MSDARSDGQVIHDCIESMKAGCGCLPHGLPGCRDKRCPNSPDWAGLVQFDWRTPVGLAKISP